MFYIFFLLCGLLKKWLFGVLYYIQTKIMKVSFVTADWKDIDGLVNDFKKSINKVFKGHVYQIPSFKGSDMYGFIISDKKLTKKEIKNLDI